MAMSPLNVGSPSESLKRESPGASEGVVLSLRKHHVTTPLSLTTTTNNTQVFSVIEGQIMQEVDDVCDDVVDDVVDDVPDDVDDEVSLNCIFPSCMNSSDALKVFWLQGGHTLQVFQN